MGNFAHSDGHAFRVWAPNADAVSVIGSFNDWNPTAGIMKAEDGGTWYVHAPNAREGDAYKYHLSACGHEFNRPDPRARKMENSAGSSIVWRASACLEKRFQPPTLDRLVIYEMHIGSFHVQERQPHGTFISAIEKLGYLKNLGINAIEIMPASEFAGDFSWGYNPACPYAVESAYGGPEGLIKFVQEAHRHGIAVIMDVVYNHFGPSDLGLWQFDGWSEKGKGGIYFYNDHRSSTPWGDTRPDYGRGEVRSYIRDNAMMWLEEYGMDGLRWDMTLYVRSCSGNPDDPGDEIKDGWGLAQWVNSEIHAAFPAAITIAEDLRDNEWLVKDAGVGGAGFHTQWDASFVHPVRGVMTQIEDDHRDLDAVIHALTTRYDGDAFKRVVYSESHDEVANGKARLPHEISPGDASALPALRRANIAAILAFTAPGVPMVFQGQEFLTDGWFRDDVPLDWSKPETFRGVHALYRDLIRLRLDASGVSAGLSGQHVHVHHVEHERKIIGFHRARDGGPGDDVLVVINLRNQAADDIRIGVPALGLWKIRFNSDAKVYGEELDGHPCVEVEAIEGDWDGKPWSIRLSAGAYAGVILSQNRV